MLKFDIVRTGGHRDFESHLDRILRDYEVDTVIDVGANLGQFGTLVRALGFKGKMHSFEPVESAYNTLSRLATGDDEWTVHKVALGNREGKATINVSRSSDFSSFLNPNDFGRRRFQGINVMHRQQTDVTTFDTFFDRYLRHNARRIMLKMDTQGYDMQVFEGAKGSLNKICSVLSELPLVPLYEEMPDYLEALSIFRSSGFAVSGLYPVSRNHDLSLIEINCIFVKPPADNCPALLVS